MSATPLYYDSKRRPVAIGGQIASAGEGRILEVSDGRNLVAKLYHKSTPLKAEKLRYMTQVCNDRLTSLAAWPTDTLHNSGGEIVGFLMPRIAGAKEIHILYGPGDRKKNFPEANWAFLIRAAANTARAFAILHEQGHIVGDVNHGNLLVSAKATVALVDCDSFQVKSPQRNFLCEVGVATHTPPELQEVNFASVVRTQNHDSFGLAVLIFQLLFMGCHPFSGRFLGAGEMPIERAIKEFRFAYGDDARTRQMQPPPNTLPLHTVSTNIAFLFERAFSQTGRDSGRPSANQWVAALETLEKELRVCPSNTRHHYHKSLAICPWCALESKTRVIYFAPTFVAGAQSFPPLVSIETLWKRIEAVTLPNLPIASMIMGNKDPSPEFAEIAKRRQGFLWKTFHSISIMKARQEASARQVAATSRLEELKQEWSLVPMQQRFQALLRQLDEQRITFNQLDNVRQKKLDELNLQLINAQQERYLTGIPIRSGVIFGLGPTKVALLHSHGINSAADYVKYGSLHVPGFGPVLASRLAAWRMDLQKRFRPNPSEKPNLNHLAKLEAEIYGQRVQIINDLSQGPERLKNICLMMERERERLRTEIVVLMEQKAQAEADINAIA